ncbi:MAG: hypothetical protein PHI68_05015, partial [Candidatus Cloacimonetes bacterium]|nr:hypothetical protein [Candidatus Cloacimonadota bacterium]
PPHTPIYYVISKTVAHPDLSKYRLPNMLVVRLSFVNLFPPTTLKRVGLRPTTHYSMVFFNVSSA